MKQKAIFIFAYYSYKDPVFQSAVLPYFINIPNKGKFSFVLLTFEQKKYRTDKAERRKIAAWLKKQNILWYNVNWHSGRLKLLKKIYDFLIGFFLSVYIMIRHRIAIVYAEAFPGAIISHYLSLLFKKPHIVHSFEPHTEYMVEGGVWHKRSWETKLLSYFERSIACRARAIMTATDAMIKRLQADGIGAEIIRVPSCVDLIHFKFLPEARSALRSKLGIGEDECVVVCIGKMGGMYWEKEIFRFFQACLEEKNSFRFMFFTPDNLGKVHKYAAEYKIPKEKLITSFLTRQQVPEYLSAADFGLVPVRQYSSKRFCSPIKDGEYWACGLPIIIPSNVSDDYLFSQENGIGIVLKDLSFTSFKEAVNEMQAFNAGAYGSKEELRHRCRAFVEADRNVERYRELYADLFIRVG